MLDFGKRFAASRTAVAQEEGAGDSPVVDVRRVEKIFRSAAGVFVALAGIDFQVPTGQFVSIIGKSGSGKSTLVNMITGIDRPTAGEIVVGGTAVHALNEEQIALWRGRTIGVIFQFFQLLPGLTAVENVLLPMDYAAHLPPGERPEWAMHLLAQVGMADDAHRLPAQLSGGQQQRVAIARALANDPPLLTADEPTGNLDSKTAALVLRLFTDLTAQGKTVLMVTHDTDLARQAQMTVELADGRIMDQWRNGGAHDVR